MPIGIILHSDNVNTESTLLTYNIVLVKSFPCVWNEDDNPKNIFKFGCFNPRFAASVIEWIRSSIWGSSVWCVVPLLTGQYFQLLPMTALLHASSCIPVNVFSSSSPLLQAQFDK